jgi:hypothetical protein
VALDNNHAVLIVIYNVHGSVLDHLQQDPRVDPTDTRFWMKGSIHKKAVQSAVERRRVSVVSRMSEDPRVDVAGYDSNALEVAALEGHIDVMNRLFEDPRLSIATAFSQF